MHIWWLLLPPLAVLAGCGAVYVMNHIPASWLCEYGAEPTGILADPQQQRISGSPWKLVFTCFFMVAGLYIFTIGGHGILYGLPLLTAVWLLLMIALADGKFMIIPDQFVVFLMLMSIAFMPFGARLLDMIKGAVTGAGMMLIIALIGWLLSGRESLGFGDVKLMAAIGLNAGFYGTVVILALGSVIAGIWFSFGLLNKKYKREQMLPLGPFLAGSAIGWMILM